MLSKMKAHRLKELAGIVLLCLGIGVGYSRQAFRHPSPPPLGRIDRDSRLYLWDLVANTRQPIESIETEIRSGRYQDADAIAGGLPSGIARAYCRAYIDFKAGRLTKEIQRRLKMDDVYSSSYSLSGALIFVRENQLRDIPKLFSDEALGRLYARSQRSPITWLFAIQLGSGYKGLTLAAEREQTSMLCRKFPELPILKVALAARLESAAYGTTYPEGRMYMIAGARFGDALKLRREIFEKYPGNAGNLYSLAHDLESLQRKTDAQRAVKLYFSKFGPSADGYDSVASMAKRLGM